MYCNLMGFMSFQSYGYQTLYSHGFQNMIETLHSSWPTSEDKGTKGEVKKIYSHPAKTKLT